MKTDDLREAYLSFFESKGCVRRPSDVLVPHGDPTVLFTPAGMNQFKNQFLGVGPIDFTKATTCQKCIRTGDIGNVGVTAYHHTFFEMLGNFSFGDYFKREAIHWAWEFLTSKKWLGLDPTRLTITVYLDDDEAANIWNKEIGVPVERISRCDEYENFWPAGAPTDGPDGVCGPCSEIYYHTPGAPKPVEIWNLVFTQFNRVGPPPNNLKPLPKNNIDTGMGLERTASVLQNVITNFEIDSLKPIVLAAAESVGQNYVLEAPAGRAIRRIADHVRACTMCIHEGVQPGPAKQGYIVRQLLRRALLEGFLLGKKDPFLSQLVPIVIEMMKRPYPDLAETREMVQNVIREEEKQFLSVIDRALPKFEKLAQKAGKGGTISGKDAFELHSQEGFLVELIEAMAARSEINVDRKGFEACVRDHEIKSGSGAFADSVMAEGPIDAIRKAIGKTEFLGYSEDAGRGKVVGVIADGKLVNEFAEVESVAPVGVVLDTTPFYGEIGGQVGDTGSLSGKGFVFDVTDTQRDGDLIVHIGRLKSGKMIVGDQADAKIDSDRRAGIRRAHSATHILHHALQKALGPNAMQRGSKVENDVLRFDFSHKQAMTPDEVVAVEKEINARIADGLAVTTDVVDIKTARERGAKALFGEKYPDMVRMVSMGEFSKELCGGTHLSNTGQVGLARIVSEEPVAAGVRRIVAYTGEKAIDSVRDQDTLLKQLMQSLRAGLPSELLPKVTSLQDELRQVKQELAQYTKASVAVEAKKLLDSAEVINGVKVICHKLERIDRDQLRAYVDELRSKGGSVALLLAAVIDDKVALVAAVTKDVQAKVKASDCVREAAKAVGGGGGGRPDLAEAGGKDPNKIPEALAAARQVYEKALKS
jgi:alanyl-tRNA synthetase